MTRKKSTLFSVWIAQVNQTCIQVKAKDPEQAAEKAYRAWRRGPGHSYVNYVETAREKAK